MKFAIALITATFSLTAFAAGSLTIKEGEVYTVGPDQQRMTLDSLKIGDGARVRFAEGVSQWQLRVQQAAIGNGVIVEASGADGASGEPGKGFERGAGGCVSGKAGGHGSDGGRGGDAVSLRMQMGLLSLGSLKIVSNGGDGGNGGSGGNGQDAGEFTKTCQSPPTGGDAGRGGNGGSGGHAGDVTVMYWPATEAMAGVDVPALIQVEAEPGRAGAAGSAGKPGAGSEGRYVKKRTLTGDRAWVSGGDKGAKADPGVSGESGMRSRVLVEQALVAAQPMPVAPAPAPAPASSEPEQDQQEIRELKDTLKALMRRLDELEQKQ